MSNDNHLDTLNSRDASFIVCFHLSLTTDMDKQQSLFVLTNFSFDFPWDRYESIHNSPCGKTCYTSSHLFSSVDQM